MNFIKSSYRFISFLLTFVLLLTGCSQGIKNQTNEPIPSETLTEQQKAFDGFLEDQLVETLETDYYTLHSYVTNPEDYGIDVETVDKTFGRFDEKSIEEDRTEIEETLEQLESFDYDELTEDQKDTYDAFRYQMECSQELSDPRFDYIGSLFSPMTGLQVSLPSIFENWDLYSAQDVENLILMMEDVDDYIQSAINYTYIQEDKGYMCINFDDTISYCEQVLSQGTESSTLKGLKEKISNLNLSEKETNDYQSQLEIVFQDSYLGGYQNLLEALKDLQTNGENHPNGLASFDVGKEYYTALMQSQIGSFQNVDDVKSMMSEASIDHLQKCVDLSDNGMKSLFYETDYTSYEEILEDVKSKMSQDFPTISNTDYEVEDMDEDIATNNGIAAYFMIPTLDGDQTGQLRVNPLNSDISSLDTYMTVCHEGLPGHMYQYNYARENIDQPVRWNMLSSIAYTEGYATYVENYCLCYLEDSVENGLRFYSEYLLSIYDAIVVADIGIHYEDWDFEQAQEEMEAYGLTLNQDQYDQLLYTPCTFEPYYVGYEVFSNYREDVQEALGSNFDEKEFHTVLLEAGSVPFEVVDRHIDRYLSKQS